MDRFSARGAVHLRVHAEARFVAQSGGSFFSRMGRSVLRHIRVTSKAELKRRLQAYFDEVNRDPVIHKWTYKIDKAA